MKFIFVFFSTLYFLLGSAQAADKRYTTNCKVFFFEEIDSENTVKLLHEVSAVKGCDSVQLPELILQSVGGTVEHAVNVFEEVKDKVCTTLHSSSSSAAVLWTVAGKSGCRKMHKDAFLMFHPVTFPEEEVSSRAEADSEESSELSNEQEGNKILVVARYAKIVSTRSLLSQEQVREFMQKVTFISAQDALKMGLIDEIVD